MRIAVAALLVLAVTLELRRRGARRARRRADEELAAAAAAGSGGALARLGERLATTAPSEAMAALLAVRRHLRPELAPALVAGLRHPAARVAEACAQELGELGAPGLRAAWAAYMAGPRGAEAERLRALLLRHPDWLFARLFDAWLTAGDGAGAVPYADLWRDAGLAQRLRALAAEGDPHVAPAARALLARLEGAAAPVAAGRP